MRQVTIIDPCGSAEEFSVKEIAEAALNFACGLRGLHSRSGEGERRCAAYRNANRQEPLR